jgi:hypothetical protein
MANKLGLSEITMKEINEKIRAQRDAEIKFTTNRAVFEG